MSPCLNKGLYLYSLLTYEKLMLDVLTFFLPVRIPLRNSRRNTEHTVCNACCVCEFEIPYCTILPQHPEEISG